MAAELPYFRFTVAEWMNGDISMEKMHTRGLFIDICAWYWFKDCSVTKAMLQKKFQFPDSLEELFDSEIIKIDGENIIIEFLNDQFDILSEKRKRRQAAGSKGGKQKSSNAKAKPKQKSTYKDKDKDKDKENNKDKSKASVNSYKDFYREQWELSKGHPLASKYQHIIKYIMNIDKNVIDESGTHILKLKKQLSFEDFATLHSYCEKRSTSIKEMIDSWLNKPAYSTGRVSVYACLRKWAGKAPMAGSNFQDNKQPIIRTSIGKP